MKDNKGFHNFGFYLKFLLLTFEFRNMGKCRKIKSFKSLNFDIIIIIFLIRTTGSRGEMGKN